MFIVIGAQRFNAVLRDALGSVQESLAGIKSVADLSGKVKSLREELEKLKIEKARQDEDFARKEREIEHKVGLERKRQEFEIEAAKREATVAVREENLKADRERFTEQMKFHDERFSTEVTYLKDTLAEVLKRLPSAEFTADLTPSRRGR